MNNNNDIFSNVETLDIDEPVVTTAVNNQFIKEAPPLEIPPSISETGGIVSSDWQQEEEKKKKGKLKYFLIVLIIILIGAMGYGIYYFLTFAKDVNEKNLKLNEIKIELGSKVSDDINDYVEDKKDCKLNTEDIDSTKVGKYTYKIICDDVEYTGDAIVQDTTAPQVLLKTINIATNEEIKADDFISSVYDLSKYTVSFDNEEYKEKIKTAGLYFVDIIVKDEYKNSTNESGVLLVSNIKSSKFLNASKMDTTSYNASLKITDSIGFNNSNYYINAYRMYEYTFNSKEELDSVKKEFKTNGSIGNVKGIISVQEDTLKLTQIVLLNNEDLNALNGRFPSSYYDVLSLYSTLGYTNKIEMLD